MSGIIGKFIWTTPAIVSVALIDSWAESSFVLPVQIHEMQRRRKSKMTLQEEQGGKFLISRNLRPPTVQSSAA